MIMSRHQGLYGVFKNVTGLECSRQQLNTTFWLQPYFGQYFRGCLAFCALSIMNGLGHAFQDVFEKHKPIISAYERLTDEIVH